MKYFFLIPLFVLIMIGVGDAFADVVNVSIPAGASVPGCEITNSCFIPYEVIINVGDLVTWSNDDSAAHTVTSGTPSDGPEGNFDSGLFMAGSTFSVTFDESGEYPYFCMVHPWKKGTVSVEDTKSSNSKCGAGTVFSKVSNSCVLDGSKISSETKCSAGTIFDSITNSCVLVNDTPLDKNDIPEKELGIVEEIFEFDIRKDRYVAKEPIHISGHVQYIKQPPYINIRILDGNDKLVENVYVLPGKDNYFFYHTKSLPFWDLDMTYTVRVTYDGHIEEKYFDLVNHSKDYDPQSVKSLQTQLAKANIKNNNLLKQIEELKQQIIQKEKEMTNMFCYKMPV